MAKAQQAITSSGHLLYNRAVKLTIAPPLPVGQKAVKTQSAMVVEDLRVSFKVKKTPSREPNPGEVTVYNLSPTSRAQLQGKGSRVWLEAGYATTLAQIFTGDVRFIEHKREGSDWVTKLELGDGERSYVHARINKSWKGGATRASIVQDIVNASGWDPGNLATFLPDLQQQELNGFVANGPVRVALTRLLASRGLTWSIQDNALQIRPKKGYTATVSAVLLDVDHGLIGSPESGTAKTPNGPRSLKVKSLLQAQLLPGVTTSVVSDNYSGTYVIQSVEHTGDTHGGDWYSECEAK